MTRAAYLLTLFMAASAASMAEPRLDRHHVAPSPYAGQETRRIKSLSNEDIAELRRGGGWGLARAAELNGFPGPYHLLELKDQIPLEDGQIRAILRIFEVMREQAIDEGLRLIAHEQELEDAFSGGTINEKNLPALIAAIEASRSRLRSIHLMAHLPMQNLLTPAQLARYAALRGY